MPKSPPLDTTVQPKTSRPPWMKEIIDKYRSGNAVAFLLHGGGVFDYSGHPEADLPVRDYVTLTLAGQMTVVNYSPHEGIYFIGPEAVADAAKRRFLTVTGLASQGANESANLAQQVLGGGQAEPDLALSPEAAIPRLIQFLQKCDGNADGTQMRAAVVIDRLDLIVPPADKGTMPGGARALLGLMHAVGSDNDIDQQNNLLIMLTPSLEEIHPDLRMTSSGIHAVQVPPPNFGERLEYVNRILDRKGVRSEMPANELAANMAGLYRRSIEDVVLAAKFADGVITRTLIRDRKRSALAQEYSEVLEVLDSDITMDMVGGHDLAKAFLAEWVLGPMQDEDLLDMVPLGILFLGPPGTGKTLLAQALANSSGLNCVLLRADKIKGSLVGESEKRLAKAIEGIEALAPCVVFLDEIDQKIRRTEAGAGDGGSAVEANIFGRLLEFFGDGGHRGRIIAIAASNRPDLVDAALKRPGRFDTKIPLLPPDSNEERVSVLNAQLTRYGFDGLDNQDVNAALAAVATSTKDWTQAELERLVVMARGICRVQRKPLAQAIGEARARLKANTSDIVRMSKLALAECDDLALVPERWRQSVATPAPKVDGGIAGPVRPAREGRGEKALDL